MSTGISGKNVKKNNYEKKDLDPGIVKARIVGLAVVKKDKVMNTKGLPEYEVQIHLEGPAPSPTFVGWQKDPQNPSKGTYKGPFKIVKHGSWPIKEFTFTDKKTGKDVTISANDQILQLMQEIVEGFGKPNLFDEPQYQKEFKTWSDYIKQMNQDLQFGKNYIWWCLGGSKNRNKQGYIVYYLNLPEKKLCQNKPRIALTEAGLCEYDESVMIFVNEKSMAANKPASSHDETDEEFNTEGLDTEDADFGGSDMGAEDNGTLFEGAEEFDEFDAVDDDDAF
jgi:hypothetical protein